MSPLPYEIALALRYLRPKRTFVSIITLICVLGVTLGVAVLMIVIAVMTGFGEQLRERILGFNAHLRVEAVGKPLSDWRTVAATVSSNASVRAVAPYVHTQVLMETQPVTGNPRPFAPVLRGVDPILEPRVSEVPAGMITGKFDVGPNKVLIGVSLAEALGLRVGDSLAVYSLPALKRMHEAWEAGRKEVDPPQKFHVAGVFDAGLYQLEMSSMLTGLGDAQDLHGIEDNVTGITIMLHQPDMPTTTRVHQQLTAELGSEFQVISWMQDNRQLLGALVVEKNMMFYLLFFIVIVAAFGIMSALITFVVQKTREIGMLKALGATPVQVALVFLSQSLVVGVVGVISGFALGWTGIRFRNDFLHFMNRTFNLDLFPPELYQFRELPARIVTSDVVIICGGSLVICLLAGVVPALRAAWLQPVQALRHE
ncbi:MAG: Lipoprotein-releasing system transrane protein LolC [Verrucomicrobiota bacterium]